MTNRMLGAFCIVLTLLFCMPVVAQEQPADSAAQAKLMAYMELGMPGPEHERIAKMAGSWDIYIKFWMEPGAEPITVTIQGENQMILKGRFLESTSTGEMMGMPTEGLNLFGYDRRNKKFVTYGFDTQGTYAVSATGDYIDDNTIRMFGKDYDGYWGFTQEYYFDVTFINDDHYTWSVTFTDDHNSKGTGEFTMVKIEYHRKK